MEEPHLPPEPHGTGGIWQTWSRGRLFFFGLLLLAANFLLQIVVYGLTDDLFVPVLFGSLIGIIVPCYYAARSYGGSLSTEFHVGPISPMPALRAILIACAAMLPVSLLAELSARIHAVPEDWLDFYTSHFPTTPFGIAVAALAVVVAAPLAEEVLFRGILHRLARGVWGAVPAAVISALCFGLVHGEPWYLFGLFSLGLLLAFLYEMTRSITVCWLTHATHNAVSFTVMLVEQDSSETETAFSTVEWLPLVISLVCLAYLCVRFYLDNRRLRPTWD